MPPAVSIP